MSRFIPGDKSITGQRDIDVLSFADLQREYALLTAKLELARRDLAVLVNAGEK